MLARGRGGAGGVAGFRVREDVWVLYPLVPLELRRQCASQLSSGVRVRPWLSRQIPASPVSQAAISMLCPPTATHVAFHGLVLELHWLSGCSLRHETMNNDNISERGTRRTVRRDNFL